MGGGWAFSNSDENVHLSGQSQLSRPWHVQFLVDALNYRSTFHLESLILRVQHGFLVDGNLLS